MNEFNGLAQLWKLLGILLILSFSCHTLYYHPETKPDDDLWLWLSSAIGIIYSVAAIIWESKT